MKVSGFQFGVDENQVIDDLLDLVMRVMAGKVRVTHHSLDMTRDASAYEEQSIYITFCEKDFSADESRDV